MTNLELKNDHSLLKRSKELAEINRTINKSNFTKVPKTKIPFTNRINLCNLINQKFIPHEALARKKEFSELKWVANNILLDPRFKNLSFIISSNHGQGSLRLTLSNPSDHRDLLRIDLFQLREEEQGQPGVGRLTLQIRRGNKLIPSLEAPHWAQNAQELLGIWKVTLPNEILTLWEKEALKITSRENINKFSEAKSQKELSLTLFREHTNGLAIASIVAAFFKVVKISPEGTPSLYQYLLGQKKPLIFSDLISKCHIPKAALGQLFVALHSLSEYGWVSLEWGQDKNLKKVTLTELGRKQAEGSELYEAAGDFIKTAENIGRNAFPFGEWRETLLYGENSSNRRKLNYLLQVIKNKSINSDSVLDLSLKHTEGVVISSLMLILHYDGLKTTSFWSLLQKEAQVPLVNLSYELSVSTASLEPLLEFLTSKSIGFLAKNKNGSFSITTIGILAVSRIWGYGVPLSYLPTHALTEKFLNGHGVENQDHPLPPKPDQSGTERHVWRDINALGSSGSHEKYFRAMTNESIKPFNLPINQQPVGLVDVGSGDGRSLEVQFSQIYHETERGRLMKLFPHDIKNKLMVVGVDLFETSRHLTSIKLANAGVNGPSSEFMVLNGDVTKPNEFFTEINRITGLDNKSFVVTSTFLIHDRKLELRLENENTLMYAKERWGHLTSPEDGAFISEETGAPTPNELVLEDLKQHLEGYKKYCQKFGYYFADLHNPARFSSKTLGSYIVNHAQCGQYTIPIKYIFSVAEALDMQLDGISFWPINSFAETFSQKIESSTVGIYRLHGRQIDLFKSEFIGK